MASAAIENETLRRSLVRVIIRPSIDRVYECQSSRPPSRGIHSRIWPSPCFQSLRGLAGGEVLSNGGAGELLAQQAGKKQQRAERPGTRPDMLGLPGGVASDQDDTANGLTVDLGDVVLEEAVVAVGAGELEFLVLVERANSEHD